MTTLSLKWTSRSYHIVETTEYRHARSTRRSCGAIIAVLGGACLSNQSLLHQSVQRCGKPATDGLLQASAFAHEVCLACELVGDLRRHRWSLGAAHDVEYDMTVVPDYVANATTVVFSTTVSVFKKLGAHPIDECSYDPTLRRPKQRPAAMCYRNDKRSPLQSRGDVRLGLAKTN